MSDLFKKCGFCDSERPRRDTHCPHCGQPSDFPNVEDALSPDETKSLAQRHGDALAQAASRGCEANLREFEQAVARSSQAVFACPLVKLMPLAVGQVDLYASFYQLAELRIPRSPANPGDPDWNTLRPVVETALFGDQFKRQIQYAALTLDGRGLPYGECTVLLRERMIAHRASVFEENSILFMKHHDIQLFEADRLPRGYRAAWSERGKLAAAKLAERIDAAATVGQFAGILMRLAADRATDDFVEVHLFGSVTAFTFEKVTYTSPTATPPRKHKRPRTQRGSTNIEVLRDKLKEAGAEFEWQT